MIDNTEQLSYYAELLKLTDDAIFVWRFDGGIEMWNRGAEEFYGFPEAEALGNNPHVLLQTRFPCSLTEIESVLRKNQRWKGELIHQTKDGHNVTVSAKLQIIGGEDGIKHILETNRDITELKQIEEVLRESEERFRAAFENAAIGMVITSLDTRLLKVNSAFCQMVGFTEAELVGRSFTGITHPDDLVANCLGFKQIANDEKFTFRMVKRYIHKDGSVIWGDMNTTSVRDAQGKPLYVVTQIQNITERKQTEEVLQIKQEELTAANKELQAQSEKINTAFQELQSQAEEIREYADAVNRARDEAERRATELDATLSSIAAGVIIYDDLGNVIHLNEFACNIFKYFEDDQNLFYQDRSMRLNLCKSDGTNYEAFETPLYRALKGEIIRAEEMIIVRSPDEPLWLTGTFAPIHDNNHRLVGVIFTFTDITERKRQVEDLLASERELLKVTLNSLGEGVVAIDQQDRIFLINEAAANLTGFSQHEALGESLDKIFYILDNRSSEPINKFTSQEAFSQPILVTRDLREIPISINCSPIKAPDGRIIGTVTVFHDISEKQKIEQELLKTAKLDSLGILAGGVAHDFNNILAGILANLQLATIKLKRHEDISKYMEGTIEITRRASDLTKQLLTFAKGGDPIKKSATINNLVKNTVLFALSGSKVKAEFHFPEDLWVVDIDEGQITQVINNLTINAEQAMPIGGNLEIDIKNVICDGAGKYAPGSYVKLTVKDHGIGIPDQIISKIFDPFFTTKKAGNGLGLSTSYSIIKKHNGYLEVESTPGIGTAFNILLPASMEELTLKEVQMELAASGDAKILLMDDEDTIRNVGGEMLTCFGYQVSLARDGKEAIELYKRAKETHEPFDVVIMDLTIPGGLGGIETIAILRQIDPEITAIISSGYASDPVMSDYERYGFSGMVIKPYKFDELNEVLNKVIDKKQLPLDLTY